MFYRILIIMWLFIFGFLLDGRCLFASDKSQPVSSHRKDHQAFMPGEIVIKTRPHVTLDQVNSLNVDHTAEIVEGHPTLNLYRLNVSESVGDATISYQSHSAVEYAQPNYIFAEVGKEFITLFDLDVAVQKMIPLFRQRYKQLQAKEKLLRSLLNDKLFFQAAKDEDLQSIPEVQSEIDKAVEKTLARVYQKRIQAGTVSEKEMMTYFKNHR